jgi:hypothetical protein
MSAASEVYEILSAVWSALDGRDQASADQVRDAIDIVWLNLLTADERAAITLRSEPSE